MKTNKLWSIMMMLVLVLGITISFSSCSKDDDDDVTVEETVKNVITIDGQTFDIESIEVERFGDRVRTEFGNHRNRIYCMVDFYGTNIPVGTNITLRRLEVEDEANNKLEGGAYDGTAVADVSRDGDIYTITVSKQTILDDENETRHIVSLSYKGTLY